MYAIRGKLCASKSLLNEACREMAISKQRLEGEIAQIDEKAESRPQFLARKLMGNKKAKEMQNRNINDLDVRC